MAARLFHPLSLAEFLSQPIQPRKPLLGSWFLEKQFTLLVGEAGAGKSFFAYTIGLAIAAAGEAFGWKAAEARRVGVLDGEMADSTIAARLSGLLLASGAEKADLQILTRDMVAQREQCFPDLRNHDEMRRVLDAFAGAGLIIADNLNCLFGGGDENATPFWRDIERFWFECRKRGMSLLLLHHAPKTCPDRPAGSSKNERLAENVIVLNKLPGNEMRACTFNVSFRKTRERTGDTESFSAELIQGENDELHWKTSRSALATPSTAMQAEVKRLKASGMTVRQIADAMGMSSSTIGRWTKGQDNAAHVRHETAGKETNPV